MTETAAVLQDLRGSLEPLPWAERFERLKAVEKTADPDARAAIAGLRAELAARALVEVSPEWEGVPFKEGILRLPGKRMRGALTRAAKEARNRYIVSVMQGGGPPLDPAPGAARFAQGLDERAIEMPLALFAAGLSQPGQVLDAGAALNLPVVREIVGRPVARLTHFTLPGANETPLPGDPDRFEYAFGDLRAMPYADGAFDRVVCVSTLEHVDLDNTRYSDVAEPASGPPSAAVAELVRVLAPGGTLLVTVPYGAAREHEWFRIFDAEGLRALLAPAQGLPVAARYFYYDAGWAEGGPVAPAAVLASPFAADVITGVAIVHIVKTGAKGAAS